MTVTIKFNPMTRENLKKGRCDIWANVKFKMFPEMEGEFNRNDYLDKMVQIEGEEVDNGYWEYNSVLEYPWGSFAIEVLYTPKGQKEEDFDPKPIPDDEKELLSIRMEPMPISMDELRNIHV